MILTGIVISGKGRGKSLGFPTANLLLQESWTREGVFLAQTKWKRKTYPSLFFSGQSKTFYETDWSYEVHLLEFSGNLYGETLTVDVLKKIRNNRKFKGSAQLINAIHQDVREARKFFQKNL